MLSSKRPGMSIIEMLMVLMVIAFIGSIIVPRILQYQDRIKEGKAKLVLSSLQEAVSSYEFDIGHAPTRQEGALSALIKRPSRGSEEWSGPYIIGADDIPKDPWGNEFIYNTAPNLRFKKYYKKFEIFSYGGDEENDNSNKLRVGA
jgi:general secretion pathway protein G